MATTITTELLDQSIQLLNSVNIPVGQLETIGIPVYRAFNNLVTFRRMLIDITKKPKESEEVSLEEPVEFEAESEAESESESDVGLTD